MPEINGLEAIRQIRNNPQFLQTPIIILTALALEKDKEKALELGANECIVKPVKLNQLDISIKKFLILEESN